jgi:bacterioferritin-associated ferredoxin
MRTSSGITNAEIKDAVRLNLVDDLDELQKSLHHH